jgi:FolB domain-containing protein
MAEPTAYPDRIYVRDLPVQCIIGELPHERLRPQTIVLNVELHCDLRAAGESDDLADTVDYAAVEAAIASEAAASADRMLERLAARLARRCLGFAGVGAVRLRIDKPAALGRAAAAAVEIFRRTGEL